MTNVYGADCNPVIPHCTSCDEATKKICNQCAEGYYKASDTVCTACLDGCQECTGAGQCTKCKDGFYPDKADKITKCTACSDTNCAKCSDKDTCTECNKDFTPVGGKCVSNTQCKTDVPNCATCDATTPTKCIGCKDTFVLVEGKCVSSTACITKESHCTKCNTTTPTKCTACADKYTLNATGFCEKNGSKDLTTYSITYFMTFACLLITLAFVAFFAQRKIIIKKEIAKSEGDFNPAVTLSRNFGAITTNQIVEEDPGDIGVPLLR
ncbi:hypothetical protein O3M35_013325 [Rhynocoris fuscipes]|uniref:TNFR-Cys domain-containing protein n=1 Tax=Rhynocoris fuscipes TaxID=488301 RepID=A0AAW1CJI5_9HEMI